MSYFSLSKPLASIAIAAGIFLGVQSCKKNNTDTSTGTSTSPSTKTYHTYPYSIRILGCRNVGNVISFGYYNDNFSIKSILWNFGDGVTSTEPYPAHTYDQPGSYMVKLLIDNDSLDAQTQILSITPVIAGSPYTALMGGIRLWSGLADGYIIEWGGTTYENTQITDTPWTVQIIDAGTVIFSNNIPLHLESIDTIGQSLFFSDCQYSTLYYFYFKDSMVYDDSRTADKYRKIFRMHTP